MNKKLIMAALALGTCLSTLAQKAFTLNDLLSGGNNWYNLQPARKYTTWWGNTPVETTPDGCKDLSTGRSIVTVERLNKIAGQTVVHNGHYITFPYADLPIAEVRSTKQIMQLNFKSGKVEWSVEIPNAAQNVDLSHASRNMAYTFNGNLFMVTAQGDWRQISSDGSIDDSENIVYGRSVHRDEFGISKGTFWSADGQRLAFYRMDQSMVPSYPQVDITQRIATTYTDKYPMAGETSHQVKVGVYDVATDEVIYLDLLGEADDYHTNISWAPDGKTIYVFELNRDQNDMRLVSYDARTGRRKSTILHETHPKYVEPMNPLVFLPWDDTKAIMQSQRDGYNHLYLLDLSKHIATANISIETDGGKSEDYVTVTQLTKGDWVVQDFLGFNTKTKSIIYKANPSDPRRSCIYSVSAQGGKSTLIGADDGVHYATLSSDGQQLIDSYTSPTVPRSINILSTTTGKGKNVLTAKDPWAEQGYNIPEISSGSIKAGDGVTDLYYRMVKPVGFDPSKKYPTVVYVYGGPHAHNVDASWHWSMRGWEAYMAQKGYLLFILDNRGSEWRGRAFEQTTFRHLGDIEMEDQIQGVNYLKTLPYVDADRMGVHGWSFGGFMTTNLMCSYPDVFKVGVAGGPVIDWRYYEVMYGERYMDTPESNPDGYKSSSLLGKAKNLKGRLEIVIGYNDPTCVPQHALSFLRACEDAGTQPDFFCYPGDGHNMFGSDMVHLHERITRYFEDHLK